MLTTVILRFSTRSDHSCSGSPDYPEIFVFLELAVISDNQNVLRERCRNEPLLREYETIRDIKPFFVFMFTD